MIDKSSIQEKVMDIIKGDDTLLEDIGQVSDLYNVSMDEMGFSSISYIKLLVLIENEFDIEIPDDYLQLYEFPTIGSIVDYIAGSISED